MRRTEFILRRLLFFVPIFFGVSIIVFLLIHLVPGSPAVAILGVNSNPEAIEALEKQLGLHKPLLVQYVDWIGGILMGDWGMSYTNQEPVSEMLMNRFLISLELVILTMVTSLLISIPLGIIAALNQQKWPDYGSMGIGIIGVSFPVFFSSILLMEVFAVRLDLLPVSGYIPIWEDPAGNLTHMILQTISLSLVAIAVIMRMMRSSMIETIREEYVRFLKAKGLTRRSILFGHALKNSFIPVITIIGLQFGYLLSGTVVVEQIFAIPGLGRTVVQAALQRDYPLVQGAVLLLALWFATVNLLTDFAVASLDPRILEEK
jgi:peptide/nickel transport system permease protein